MPAASPNETEQKKNTMSNKNRQSINKQTAWYLFKIGNENPTSLAVKLAKTCNICQYIIYTPINYRDLSLKNNNS